MNKGYFKPQHVRMEEALPPEGVELVKRFFQFLIVARRACKPGQKVDVVHVLDIWQSIEHGKARYTMSEKAWSGAGKRAEIWREKYQHRREWLAANPDAPVVDAAKAWGLCLSGAYRWIESERARQRQNTNAPVAQNRH